MHRLEQKKKFGVLEESPELHFIIQQPSFVSPFTSIITAGGETNGSLYNKPLCCSEMYKPPHFVFIGIVFGVFSHCSILPDFHLRNPFTILPPLSTTQSDISDKYLFFVEIFYAADAAGRRRYDFKI